MLLAGPGLAAEQAATVSPAVTAAAVMAIARYRIRAFLSHPPAVTHTRRTRGGYGAQAGGTGLALAGTRYCRLLSIVQRLSYGNA